ncbi:MAG: hypothetical protein IKZ58_05280 [Selenomonadaceae bacterium]|nr:hypothetical protein [Selenomonadaceae bacterium]
MTKSLRIFVLTVALMLAASVPALAETVDFVLVNNTGSAIFNVYIAPSESDQWGEDVLGDSGTISAGESHTMRGGDSDVRYWDIRVVFDNEVYYDLQNIDLFTVSRIIVNADGTYNYQ